MKSDTPVFHFGYKAKIISTIVDLTGQMILGGGAIKPK